MGVTLTQGEALSTIGGAVAVDTSFVGILKGVGKAYLQTALDTLSRMA